MGLRAACEPLFHSGALSSYASVINRTLDTLVARLEAASGTDAGVNVSQALAAMTMDVIGQTAFG